MDEYIIIIVLLLLLFLYFSRCKLSCSFGNENFPGAVPDYLKPFMSMGGQNLPRRVSPHKYNIPSKVPNVVPRKVGTDIEEAENFNDNKCYHCNLALDQKTCTYAKCQQGAISCETCGVPEGEYETCTAQDYQDGCEALYEEHHSSGDQWGMTGMMWAFVALAGGAVLIGVLIYFIATGKAGGGGKTYTMAKPK